MSPASRTSQLSSLLLIALCAAVTSTALLLYFVPADASGAMGLAPEGAERFQQALGLDLRARVLAPASFVFAFRVLLACQWAAWIALVARAFVGLLPNRRLALGLLVALVVALAALCPPVLSRDVFAYVAYGRIAFDHGLNPYLNDRAALEAAADPAAAYLVWSSPLPYGPAWTMLAAAIAAISSFGGPLTAAALHKFVAGICLLVVAEVARRLANLREEGRGSLTFLAVAFNPLLLLEGPGTGHNDLVMLACLAGAALSWARDRERWSGALVGLAVAIKPVAIVALPLMVLQDLVSKRQTRWSERTFGYLIAALSVPLVLTVAFGGPFVVARAVIGQGAAPLGLGGRLIGGVLVVGAGVWASRYLRGAQGAYPAWFTAWVPCAALLIVLGTRQWFPWYMSWLLVPSLTGWDESHRILTTAAVTCAVMLQYVYTVGV
jgi:hypothetical protein